MLVLGNGYLGSAFRGRGFDVWGKDRVEVTRELVSSSPGSPPWSFLDGWDAVVNCVAVADVARIESGELIEQAWLVNARWPGVLSRACGGRGIKFAHVSTGCLYPETDALASERDPVVTGNAYCETKLAGDLALDTCEDLILRPRLLFDNRKTSKNFLHRVKHVFEVFSDHVETMTCVLDVVEAARVLVGVGERGVYNVGCRLPVSTEEVARVLGVYRPVVAQDEIRRRKGYHLSASVMDVSKIEKHVAMPATLDRVLEMAP